MKKLIKIGPISFNHYSLKRATNYTIQQWFKDFSKYLSNYANIKVWLVGSFLTRPKTAKDVDIVLTGTIDFKNMYNILKKGYQLAYYKYKFKLDLQWISKLIIPYNKNNQQEIIKYRLMDKVIINNKIVWDDSKNSKEVFPGLFKIQKIIPTTKQLDYMKQGYIYKQPEELKC